MKTESREREKGTPPIRQNQRVHTGISEVGGSERADKSDRPVKVGGADEQLQTGGRGNNLQGTAPQLTADNQESIDLNTIFSEDTAVLLKNAFDENRQEGFLNNIHKQRKIKKALYDILNDKHKVENCQH